MENFSYKILIVEDLEIAKTVAVLTFVKLGCDVDSASTGAEAIEKARNNTYQIIFMDLGLPDIDGFQVTEEILKMQSNKNVLIIALTAHDTEEDKERCFAIGMRDLITKPLSSEKAILILQKYAKSIPELPL